MTSGDKLGALSAPTCIGLANKIGLRFVRSRCVGPHCVRLGSRVGARAHACPLGLNLVLPAADVGRQDLRDNTLSTCGPVGGYF